MSGKIMAIHDKLTPGLMIVEEASPLIGRWLST